MTAPTCPARMTGADHAGQIDADLDVIYKKRLPVLFRKAGAQHQSGDARDPAVLEPILRHIFDRFFKAEKARADPVPD